MMQKRRALTVLSGIIAFTLYAAASGQSATLTFDQINDGGTLSYDGYGGTLIGTNILFDAVRYDNTILECRNCQLNFETGTNITDPNGAGFFDWNAGGTFIITGEIYDGTTLVVDGDLLEGSFTSSPSNPWVQINNFMAIAAGFGIDHKNQYLLDYLQITESDFIFASTNISAAIATLDKSTGKFLANVTEADIVNKAPEPNASLILGGTLIGLMAYAIRRRDKPCNSL